MCRSFGLVPVTLESERGTDGLTVVADRCPLMRSPLVLASAAGSAGLFTNQTVEPVESVGVEIALLNGLLDGTTRLLGVGTVMEVASLGELGNLRKHFQNGLLISQQTHLAKTRSIDDQSAFRKLEELASRGDVAPSVIGFPNRSGGLTIPAEQTIDQRRLADTG